MKNITCLALGVLTCTAVFGAVSPRIVALWPMGAPGAEARRDEPEKITGGNVSNIHFPTIAVYLPAREVATGAGVVVCPGGGHRFLVMGKEGTEVAEWLAAHGVAAFVLKNRLARDDANPEGKPQPYTIDRDALADAQRALRLVRSRAAEWGLRTDAIGIMGFSAGGEISALAAMQDGAGNPMAPDPIDRLDARPSFQGLIYPGQSQRIQPQQGAPPAFLCCGADDRPDISEGLPAVYLRFKAAGVPVELHIYAGIGHGFGRLPGAAAGWPDAFRAWLVQRKFILAGAP